MTESLVRVGVIGGSGLYDLPGLSDVEHIEVTTPFGSPSDRYIKGRLGEAEVFFLPRHGRGHRIIPSQLNFRANVHGFKQLGVEWIISVSAVGSMREDLEPGHIVIPHQYVDWTRHRQTTFFGDGVAAHVSMADPVCVELSDVLFAAGTRVGANVHHGGTYLCIEGPQFSTRGESLIYRQWGVDVIGMTNMPEAKLAREAEISYATLAMVTDYDCWHDTEQDVDVAQVIKVLNQNVNVAQAIITEAVPHIRAPRTCACAQALRNAIITDAAAISSKRRQQLELIIGKYLPTSSE